MYRVQAIILLDDNDFEKEVKFQPVILDNNNNKKKWNWELEVLGRDLEAKGAAFRS